MEYELDTIEDIYRKVPPDRWEVCLSEMLKFFKYRRQVEIEFQVTNLFPRKMTWKDDNKQEIGVAVEVGGVEIYRGVLKADEIS